MLIRAFVVCCVVVEVDWETLIAICSIGILNVTCLGCG